MSDYYGAATLEDWLAEEVFSQRQLPKEVVAVFEPYRNAVEKKIEEWLDSDDGYGNPLSWRGWGRGFDVFSDEEFERLYACAEKLLKND